MIRPVTRYPIYTGKEAENAVTLAMDLITSERWDALHAQWWDRLEGTCGFNNMVLSIGKQLELAVEEAEREWGDDLDWFLVIEALGGEILRLVVDREHPPIDPSIQQQLCHAAIDVVVLAEKSKIVVPA